MRMSSLSAGSKPSHAGSQPMSVTPATTPAATTRSPSSAAHATAYGPPDE